MKRLCVLLSYYHGTILSAVPEQNFQDLKVELVEQGRQYANEAMSYREKIAKLALGFIKDGSVVSAPQMYSVSGDRYLVHRSSPTLTPVL